jgi:hypothetical protein
MGEYSRMAMYQRWKIFSWLTLPKEERWLLRKRQTSS